jgi:FkbM family methyltransferase
MTIPENSALPPLDNPPPPAPRPPANFRLGLPRPNALAPNFDKIPIDFRTRVAITISCTDADHLPRVEQAGEVIDHPSGPVQIMHNGVLVEEGCYYGTLTGEIIRCLRGVHEPQEERVFAELMKRLAETTPTDRAPTMIELGSFWAYYSLWFLNDFPNGRSICLEPDAHHLEVGKRNFETNGRTGTFINAAIGVGGGSIQGFVTETNPTPVDMPSHDLESLLAACEIAEVDVLLSDIQGGEVPLLIRASERLRQGAVRFLVVSTHDLSITGSASTHQQVLDILLWSGAHIIAEHSVSESYSGDGLIVASFDPRDRDMNIEISHNRSRDSLFGEWEPRLEEYRLQLHAAKAEMEQLQATRTLRLRRKVLNLWNAVRN